MGARTTSSKRSVPTVPLSKVAAEFAEKTGMTKKDATGALDDFVGLVVKHLKKGQKVAITGLGILQVRNRQGKVTGSNRFSKGSGIFEIRGFAGPEERKMSKKVAVRVSKNNVTGANADEARIIDRVKKLVGDEELAKAWFAYQPLPAFDNKTPRQLVDEGRMKAVLLHLQTLEDGVYA